MHKISQFCTKLDDLMTYANLFDRVRLYTILSNIEKNVECFYYDVAYWFTVSVYGNSHDWYIIIPNFSINLDNTKRIWLLSSRD